MPKQKTILIKKYDYVEYSDNKNNQTVIAIYGVDSETLNKLQSGTVVIWDDGKQNATTQKEGLKWNGEVFAIFEDFVIVYLY